MSTRDDRQVAENPKLGNQSPELGSLAFTEKDFDGLGKWVFNGAVTTIEADTRRGEISTRANRILSQKLQAAPVVYGYDDESIWSHKPEDVDAKKTARLVCVAPLVKDSYEQLVRDMLKTYTEKSLEHMFGDFPDRAKRLLERES